MLKARIKPYDPKLGHVMQTCVLAVLANRKFEAGKVYDVTEEEAAALRPIRSRIGSFDGPSAFDIGSEAEMAAIVSGEAKAKLGLTPEIIQALREGVDGRDVTADPRTGALTKADFEGEPAAQATSAEPPQRKRRGA